VTAAEAILAPPAGDLCMILHPNFGEFPFRGRMKSGLGVVIHYSSTHEKTVPDGTFRCRMELRRAPPARPQRPRKTEEVGRGADDRMDRPEQEDELRDYQRPCASGEVFVYAAMIRLMTRRLAHV
jgi:hypothetical protein